MQEENQKDFKKGDVRKYSRKISVTLTKKEGEQLDKIIDDNGCQNLSQLCKKLVNGTISLY